MFKLYNIYLYKYICREKKRMNLVTFGCSYTYGLSLPDCTDLKGEKSSSQYAWPKIISNEMNCSSIDNKGFPGASNYLILNNLLNYQFQKNSFVVILWTHFLRYTIYKNARAYKNINLNDDKDKSMYNLLKILPEYHLYKINSDAIIQAYHYLHYKNIPFLFSFASLEENIIFNNYQPNYTFLFKYRHFKDFVIDYGSDNSHPGILSNKEYGKYLANEIKPLIIS